MNRVLVCITPQANGRRLIDRGAEICAGLPGGELHVLHVETGCSVFASEDSSELLELLFRYASERGGVIHAKTGGDPFKIIKRFIKENKISDAVLGEPPSNLPAQPQNIAASLTCVRVHIVPRDI